MDRRHAVSRAAPARAPRSCPAKWAAAESGRKRKSYRITNEGRAQLAAHREQWKAVDGTLRGIWMQACTV